MASGRRMRFRTLVFAALFVTALTGVVHEAGRRPALETFRLPSGETLEVRGVTFGRGTHRFIQGTTLHQWLGFLPRRALEVTGARVHEHNVHPAGSDPEKALVWVDSRPAWSDPFASAVLVLADEHGCEFLCSGGASGSGRTPWVFTFFAVPRSASRLTIRAYDRSYEPRLIGECAVENPAAREPTRLGAEPLPAVRQMGAVECELTALEFETPAGEYWGWPKTSALRAWLRVTRNGRPAADLRIREVRLRDGHGTDVSWGIQPVAYAAGPDGVLLARGRFDFCRRQPAVQLTVLLESLNPPDYPVVVIPLPPGRAARPLSATAGNIRFTEVSPGSAAGEWVVQAEGGTSLGFPYAIDNAHDELGRSVYDQGRAGTVLGTLVRHTLRLAAHPAARELVFRLRPYEVGPGGRQEAKFTVAVPPP